VRSSTKGRVNQFILIFKRQLDFQHGFSLAKRYVKAGKFVKLSKAISPAFTGANHREIDLRF
jgi:hypothetical protein